MSKERKEKNIDSEEKKEKISEKEFEEKVIGLATTGMTSEKIGESLRHQGIHPMGYEKISRILKKKGFMLFQKLRM